MKSEQNFKGLLEATVSALNESSRYIEKNMGKNFLKFNDDSIKQLSLLHEDIEAALNLLPSFGWSDETTHTKLLAARNLIKDLQMIIQKYMLTGQKYQENFEYLSSIIEEKGFSDCVNDLLAVRHNARRSSLEKQAYISKIKK